MSKEKNKMAWDRQKDKVNNRRRDNLPEFKYFVFAHYSRAEVPICAWCDCVDLDMLCLDHIKDNGKEDRKDRGHSLRLYRNLIDLITTGRAPIDYQVLCANHNQKKEAIRKSATLQRVAQHLKMFQ